jgi:hypothetical protein
VGPHLKKRVFCEKFFSQYFECQASIEITFSVFERKMTIMQRNIDMAFIKFPVFFPLIYLLFLFHFPEHEYVIALLVVGFLREPHFGAT